MIEKKYGFGKKFDFSYEEAIPKLKEALKAEGFGVLTEIDVKETLKAKLNIDFSKYIILGACNPVLAHKALQAEKEIGLLLPCNVIVYEDDDGKAVVLVFDPEVGMKMVDNPAVNDIAREASEKLRRVIKSL
ncbi:MAG: DUF302 domain-containing protein [Candidatus Aminicenantia bacterium]